MPLPPLPDPHGIAVMALVAVALVLFAREKIPVERSSPAILVLLISGQGLVRTGALEPVAGHWRSRRYTGFDPLSLNGYILNP